MSYLRAATLMWVLLLASAPVLARAQFAMGDPDGRAMLLMMPDIQKELKLSDDQKKRINAEFGKFGKPGQPAPDFASMANPFAALEPAMFAVLEPEQLARFGQLYIQYEGPISLTLDDVASKVMLAQDQRSKINAIYSAYKGDMIAAFQSRGGNRAINDMKKGWKVASEAALAVLTSEQNTAYLALQGKPAKMRKREY